MLCYLSSVLQLLRKRARITTQAFWLQSLHFYTLRRLTSVPFALTTYLSWNAYLTYNLKPWLPFLLILLTLLLLLTIMRVLLLIVLMFICLLPTGLKVLTLGLSWVQ